MTRTARWTMRGGFSSLSIRHKLLALVLLPLLVVLPVLGLILLIWGNSALDALLTAKVRSDLAVARGYFDRVLGEVGSGTQAVAESGALMAALREREPGAIARLLAEGRTRHGLEFLNLLTPDEDLAYTEAGPAAAGQRLPRLAADATGAQASLALLTPAQMALVAPHLAERVPVALRATRNASPSERTQEHRAMVLIARAPVRDEQGALRGWLQGGLLLNRNLGFIDHINEIVYPQGSLPFGSVGTATLFLDDVRVSTNVRLFENGADSGERAIGTRVSQAVREAVLGRGETWLDRAFVVSEWYVSAYQPLADAQGQRVGMLYVGFLEEPFRRMKAGVLLVIGALFFGVMLAAAWVSLRWARSIFTPVERMTRTMAHVEAGDLAARVGPQATRDELAQLSGHLDHLLDVIGDKTRALQRWGEELDQKVADRTRELRSAQDQLVRSEKLAAIGQLTAGIAHEVNNPIAVIQGNLDLLRELLGPAAQPVQAELRLLDEQVERMRLIVTQLLQFARPTEYAGYVEPVDTAEALSASLVLVSHLLARTRIEVRRELHATRAAAINRQELQQVLINLLVNALQVMPEGGTITLGTRDEGAAQVAITITDTGPGFSPDVAAGLFTAFVTTKKEGTGLGLWISRNLLERYGGDLRAANRDDGVSGAVMTVIVPADQPEASGSRP